MFVILCIIMGADQKMIGSHGRNKDGSKIRRRKKAYSSAVMVLLLLRLPFLFSPLRTYYSLHVSWDIVYYIQ